jgi:hypothetical protein
MAENILVPTLSSGTAVGTDLVNDATLGSAQVQYVKMMDATIGGTNKAIVNATGTQAVANPAGALFYDTFDFGIDPQNWYPTLAFGAGAVPPQGIVGGFSVNDGGQTVGAGSLALSRRNFDPSDPSYLLLTMRVNVEYPLSTNRNRYWGLMNMNPNGPPTVAIPLWNFVGFELDANGSLYAATYNSGVVNFKTLLSSNVITTASALKYYVYFKGDLCFFAIGTPDTVVASFTSGASGPDQNTLYVGMLSICTAVGAAGTFQLNGTSLADTSSENNQISDGKYPAIQVSVKDGVPAALSDKAMVVVQSLQDNNALEANGNLAKMLQLQTDLLTQIRTELRILNANSAAGLNVLDDMDLMRNDPYFNNPPN